MIRSLLAALLLPTLAFAQLAPEPKTGGLCPPRSPGNTRVNDMIQRIFYTSLGHPDDFQEKSYVKLLTNAVGWCLKDEAITAK